MPHTLKGNRLIAHELTHVVQQTGAKTATPSLQRDDIEMIPDQYYPMVRSLVGNDIVSTAQSRMADPLIRRSYSSQIPWFFSPNSGLAGWMSKSDILEAARRRRSVGRARRWMKRSMYRRMRGLGRNLENFPLGEGAVWWGRVYTCNVFVFDAFHQAGLNPPLRGNRHYFSPGEIRNRSGALSSYFSDVDAADIQPGDVFATSGHTEIVTSASSLRTRRRRRRPRRVFNSIGAGKNGVGVRASAGVSARRKRFRRVARGVLETYFDLA